VFLENVVYVVQQAHCMPYEVEKTIFHELYGHVATASLFGGEWAGQAE
jgi:phenylalanine-4-hydroxylase